MRLRSSLALEMEPKLKLAANCSAADAIKLLPETRRYPARLLPPYGADPIWGSRPALASGADLKSCLARFALLGGFRAARLALAGSTLLVAVDLFGEGGGDAAAGLFHRFL